MSFSAPSELMSIPRGRSPASSAFAPLAPIGWGPRGARSYQLEVQTKFPPWRRPVCEWPPPGRAWRELMAPWSSFLPLPERRCWRRFRVGPRDLLWPEARGHGWAPTSPCPLDFPKPLPRGWTWRPGAKDCELGWPKELGTSWAMSPSSHTTPKF